MLLEDFPFEPGFRLTDGDLLNKTAAEPAYSVDNTVTSTGTTAATAYGIRATVTIVTGGGANTGVRLPSPRVGRLLFIWNFTATGKRVYPHDTETINGGGPADIPFSEGMVLICTGHNSWSATQASTNTTGDIILEASDADTSTGQGHLVQVQAGNGGVTSGSGGAINIVAGTAIGGPPGDGGTIQIIAGDSKAAIGGAVIISGGNPGGLVTLQTDPTNAQFQTKASGLIQLLTGNAQNAGSGTITLTTGQVFGTATSGGVAVSSGAASAAGGGSGSVSLATGDTVDAVASGNVSLVGGKNTGSAAGGSVLVTAGTGTPGGKVVITSPGGPVGLSSGFTVGVAPNSTFSVTPGATANDPAVGTVSGTGGLQIGVPLLVVGSTTQNTLLITPGAALANTITVAGSGTGGIQFNGKIGFFNTAPLAKAAVTGSRAGNAALASLLTALAATGLLTDTTTA